MGQSIISIKLRKPPESRNVTGETKNVHFQGGENAANNGNCDRKDTWSDNQETLKLVNKIVQFFIQVKKADVRNTYMAIFINYKSSIKYKKPEITMDHYKKLRNTRIYGEKKPYRANDTIRDLEDCAADCKKRFRCLWFTFYPKTRQPITE